MINKTENTRKTLVKVLKKVAENNKMFLEVADIIMDQSESGFEFKDVIDTRFRILRNLAYHENIDVHD